MAKTRNNRLAPNRSAPAPKQQAGPETPVPVPLGTIRMIDQFMEASTGPVGLARQITASLQMALDRAGLGRQAEKPAPAPQKQAD